MLRNIKTAKLLLMDAGLDNPYKIFPKVKGNLQVTWLLLCSGSLSASELKVVRNRFTI